MIINPNDPAQVMRASAKLFLVDDPREVATRILDLALALTGASRGLVLNEDGESASRGLPPDEEAEALATGRAWLEEGRDLSASGLPGSWVPIRHEDRKLGCLYLGTTIEGPAGDGTLILAEVAAAALARAETRLLLEREARRSREDLDPRAGFRDLVARSRPMQDLLRTMGQVARTDFPVLILGERGAGKTMVARTLHRSSPRGEGPFLIQSCASVPGELLENDLFGYDRGAFPGATEPRPGLFELASGGTLLLTEIEDLDLHLQARLLAVLEEGRARVSGSEREYRVGFRLMASGSDLKRAIREGRLRKDLYYRLNVVTLRVPPLRERRADIPFLLEQFARLHARGDRPARFADPAIAYLQRLPWRENARGLEEFVERVSLTRPDRPVETRDLDRFLENRDEPDSTRGAIPVGTMTLQEIEEWAIHEAMRRTGGNKTQAAAILGIHRNALIRRLQKLSDGG